MAEAMGSSLKTDNDRSHNRRGLLWAMGEAAEGYREARQIKPSGTGAGDPSPPALHALVLRAISRSLFVFLF